MPGSIVPHELALGGVLMPPMLVAAILGVLAAVATALALNRWRFRLSRYFFYPPAVVLSLTVIYTGLFGVVLFGV